MRITPVAVAFGFLYVGLSLSFGEQQGNYSPWVQQIVDNQEDARALMFRDYLPESYSRARYSDTEIGLWQSLSAYGIRRESYSVPEFEQRVREVVRRHPASPFADDAALILARGQFFWHRGVDSSLRALQKVADTYPNGVWIAENREWVRSAYSILWRLGAGKSVLDEKPSHPDSRCAHYICFEQPNRTVDEAYMTMAMLYTEGYAKPAEKQVEYYNKVIERHVGKNRFRQDLKFIAELACDVRGYLRLWVGNRPENAALLAVSDYYRSVGDLEKALHYRRQYVERTGGHPFVCRTVFLRMAEIENSLGDKEAEQVCRQKHAAVEQAWKKYDTELSARRGYSFSMKDVIANW